MESASRDGVHLSVRTPSVGSRVRAARTKDVRMTLNQFAAAVGVSTCSLSVLENGARPSKETVEKSPRFSVDLCTNSIRKRGPSTARRHAG